MDSHRDCVVLILAAGEGTRMKSPIAKVLHTLCGKSMIRYVVDAVRSLAPRRIIVVVGFDADSVKAELDGEGLEFVNQTERLGTAHAALMAGPLLEGFSGTLLVCNGDTPLLSPDTLRRFVAFHRERRAAATVLSAELIDPTGYGRVIRNSDGELLRIVEHKDATAEERSVHEINSGIFCFECEDLFPSLKMVDRRNVQGEYYITDVMEILRRKGKRTAVYRCDDRKRVIGINDLDQLRAAERMLKCNG
jgi:bifunctional UDP-N-acetylglucosamine pyrophosphorylase/glucosamine-1-phosphate N-acetyltransferase